jgi:hypothetical protein
MSTCEGFEQAKVESDKITTCLFELSETFRRGLKKLPRVRG